MAKKKSNPQSKPSKRQQEVSVQDQPKALTREPSMGDSEEKFQNLKSLNSLLLKETIQKRQQVESLVKAKEGLASELTQAGEENVSLMLEKDLLLFFVEIQAGFELDELTRQSREGESEVRLLKSEVNGLIDCLESERGKLRRVCQERDLLKTNLDVRVKEVHGLRERVTDLETKERKMMEGMGKLNRRHELLLGEKHEKEEDIEALRRENEKVTENLGKTELVIGNLNREIENIVKEKEEIEGEKKGQRLVIAELEKEVVKLNEIIWDLRKEGEVMLKKALDLEESYSEAMEKKRLVEREVDDLLAEKREKENALVRLREEKYSCEKLYMVAQMEIEDLRESRENLIREKNEIQEEKVGKDREAVELHKGVGELREIIFELQESCRNQEERNNQLASEISHCRDVNAKLLFERDEAQNALEEERKNGVGFRSRILEIEKRVEDTVAELARVRSDREKLIHDKEEIESQLGLVCKEKVVVHKKLSDAQQINCDLRAKMEAHDVNSQRALATLKNAAAFVFRGKNGKELSNNEEELEYQVEPYAAELEAIKDAFRDKERQLESLQNAVAQAQKRKSFWTVISSATTIVAAASVAYAARPR